MQDYELNGFDLNNELIRLCGDMNNQSLAVVNVVGEELAGSEPLSIHPLAVGVEKDVPNTV
jgi:hypothetical protein